jgi:hypothetical protein
MKNTMLRVVVILGIVMVNFLILKALSRLFYAESFNAECIMLKPYKLSVIVLNVVMLSVFLLCFMLNAAINKTLQ